MIRETIVTTTPGPDGPVHIAPIGIHDHGELIVIAPFRPSTTLDNLLLTRCAVVNFCDDVRVFAGCLTGRRDWPTVAADRVQGRRLAAALAHTEVALERVEDHPERPRLWCRPVHSAGHGAFRGFNRAQAAVVEAAILVSRLGMLPRDKIDGEIDYLRIAVDKTAGPAEIEAWTWLVERIARHRAGEGG